MMPYYFACTSNNRIHQNTALGTYTNDHTVMGACSTQPNIQRMMALYPILWNFFHLMLVTFRWALGDHHVGLE